MWSVIHVYANYGLLAEYWNRATYFVHKDYLGSSRLITDLNKSVVDSLDYLSFGIRVAGDTFTTRKFTGKERDSESGLDNFGAGYNSSSLGRFMSPEGDRQRCAFSGRRSNGSGNATTRSHPPTL